MHFPLLKHKRNHDALFSQLALLRNRFLVEEINLPQYVYHKTPKFITDDGRRLSIEPERSIVVPSVQHLKSVKTHLEQQVPGLRLITHSEIGFRYPTAAIAGPDAPFIKRFRSEFFHKEGEDRNICRPINLSYGIKSRGKGDNREEYEVWVANDSLNQDPSPLFIDKYGEDLPDAVRLFAQQTPLVHGWMGVKRAAFEALYQQPNVLGDLVISLALSVDAYNIGAQPDLAFNERIGSSIACGNAELEWEVMGYYAPLGEHPSQEQVWQAINASIEAIGAPLSDTFANVALATTESKTERILSTISQQGISNAQIQEWNLKPWEFLQTSSAHRRKSHDPSRSVNLLGRLNRLFYQEQHILPSLTALHQWIR
jgi:hypothetical protein